MFVQVFDLGPQSPLSLSLSNEPKDDNKSHYAYYVNALRSIKIKA